MLRAALFLAGIYAYGAAALWVNRLMADRPFTLPFSLSETSRALVGLSLVQARRHLSGDFAAWFPVSVFILGSSPSSPCSRRGSRRGATGCAQEAPSASSRGARRAYGEDTLAPFALRADKSYFFGEDERAFLAYRVVGGVAIVSGDPIGRSPSCAPCSRVRRVRTTATGGSRSSARRSAACRSTATLGLQALYHGDEAVVDTAAFSLEGRAIRKVRQSVHRLERAGYRCASRRRASCRTLRDELEAVARAWRGARPSEASRWRSTICSGSTATTRCS